MTGTIVVRRQNYTIQPAAIRTQASPRYFAASEEMGILQLYNDECY